MNLSFLLGHLKELGGRVEASTQPPDKVVASFFREKKYLGGHDRRFITEHFFAILRHRRLLETLLERFTESNHEAAQLTPSPQKYIPLYLAHSIVVEQDFSDTMLQSFEPLWKENFPSTDPAVFIEWLKTQRSLGTFSKDTVSDLGIRYSFPDWMVKEWHDEFGPETEKLLRAMNAPSNISLRVNILQASREECRLRLLKEGIETELMPYSPTGLIVGKRFNRDISQAFKDGCYEFQDEGSQLISILAAPKSRSYVIDACAGAGGKTLHLAELMKNHGRIIAVDVERKKLDELNDRAERAEVKIIQTLHLDAVRADALNSKADLVLVDAPCSGSGTIRRNPEKKWAITEALVKQYAEEQNRILEFNSAFVQQKGKLVYATCSLFRKENEEVVNTFLSTHKNFELVKPEAELQRLNITSDAKTIKLLPHLHDTDGFFVAVMQRAE